jgi:3D-(3,5/4)-trihydroxycyclohexane-1,2-dione acylhydrolase (decyclizing)
MTETIRITVGEAMVRFLIAQHIDVDGKIEPYFPLAFAIFGHGNALGIGDALSKFRSEMPTYRGQNETGMALAAVGYAKAMRRTACGVVTTSIGPGALNVVTAAGVAMANRLPLLIISGDTFNSRTPDPVLQQVEHFGTPSITVNDAFRPVTRYWDRITSPTQILSSLPNAVAVLLSPSDCGPVFIGIPQDIQAMAFDCPTAFFAPVVHQIPRPRAAVSEIESATSLIRQAKRPVIIAGGGVRYSRAEAALTHFAQQHGIPVVETVAGKSSLLASQPELIGPVGITGADPVNDLVSKADVVIAIGTRLQDFTTGSWTILSPESKILSLNAARFDAIKHQGSSVVGDARESLLEISQQLANWKGESDWIDLATQQKNAVNAAILLRTKIPADAEVPSYAQVVGAVSSFASIDDYVLTAAGGLPGELNNNWQSKAISTFDCEYGFSCMGYEISGAWGAALARQKLAPQGRVIAMTGDGSYLMLNSDIYSAVLHETPLTIVLCDNGGFAVIERLQTSHGADSYRTMLAESDRSNPQRVDFVAHASSMGASAQRVRTISELTDALITSRAGKDVHVIVIETQPQVWTEGEAFWEVGVPEVSEKPAVIEARAKLVEGKSKQRSW